ncbi:uncharacterized protein [Lolium perenne]|uniref:uncharacterized protein n=1 Tax=Lolium perenne TaxID=4522 RepID=UPI003A994D57
MPICGIPLPICPHNSYQHKPRCPLCAPYPPPPLRFRKFVLRCPVQHAPTMPTSATNSSSSLGYGALGDHLVKSLHQKTFLVEGYLQDMVGHDVVAVGHDVIGIHPTAMPSPCSGTNVTIIWRAPRTPPRLPSPAARHPLPRLARLELHSFDFFPVAQDHRSAEKHHDRVCHNRLPSTVAFYRCFCGEPRVLFERKGERSSTTKKMF